MSLYSAWLAAIEGYGYLFLHRTGQVLQVCSFPLPAVILAGMIQVPNSKGLRNGDARACSLLSAIDLENRESPVKQHVRLYLQLYRA